jgi:uncharacterized protein (TIGR03437 family)
MRLLSKLAVLSLLAIPALFAQQTCGGDTSLNSTLKGSYRFRNVISINYSSAGAVTEVTAAYGVITFNGAGGYSATGSYVDNMISKGAVQTLPTVSACYAIGANGVGYMVNPAILAIYGPQYVIFDFGSVAQGVFTGSMTEAGQTGIADLLISMPAGTPTNSTFNASYWTGFLDFTAGVSNNVKNGLFKLSPNGSGSLGTLSITGQAANLNSGAPQTQTSSAGTYNFASDGTATLNIPTPSGVTAANALFSGTKTMYVSSDGGYVLGWSPTGYDIIFGVQALTKTASQSTFKGTYYTAALEFGPQPFCNGNLMDAYSGSISADGAGNGIVHQRLWSAECLQGAYDYTTDEFAKLNSDGTLSQVDYSGYQLAFGNSGNAFVGISGDQGSSPFFSLVVGLQPAPFTGTGAFLNPTGIVNAGSFAPITAPLAPGELITLFGTGLAPATLVSVGGVPFPTNLSGVQVLINNVQAPIYYVSPTQLSVIVPYALATTTTGLAQVQVNNNGTLSNTVTLYATNSLPGIFSQNQNGLGYAIALHPDGSNVTKANPAKIGETIAVYLTGLGTVTPTVTDGSLGPTSPLSNADELTAGNLGVNFNDYNNGNFVSGTVAFAGLAPGLSGLYQMNVTIPTGVGPGDVYLEIFTSDADVNQVQVPIASATGALVPAFRSAPPPVSHRTPAHAGPPRGIGRPRIPPPQQ